MVASASGEVAPKGGSKIVPGDVIAAVVARLASCGACELAGVLVQMLPRACVMAA